MIVKNVQEIDAVRPEGTGGVSMRVAIGEEQGAPRFVMRHFEVAPGGFTPKHAHWWEHEIYILEGEGEALTKDGAVRLGAGDTVYVAPDEDHQFRNTGRTPLKFICMVPRT